jgi:hypothetical protein
MVGAGPRRIPPADPASSSASAACMPPTTPSMADEQIVMIDSCSDWKPSDHLGINIAQIGLPLLGPVSPDERRRERLADSQDGSPLPVPVP